MADTAVEYKLNTARLFQILGEMGDSGQKIRDGLLEGKVLVLEYGGYKDYVGNRIKPDAKNYKIVAKAEKLFEVLGSCGRFCFLVQLRPGDKKELDFYVVDPRTNELLTLEPTYAANATHLAGIKISYSLPARGDVSSNEYDELVKTTVARAAERKFEDIIRYAPDKRMSSSVESALKKRAVTKAGSLLPPRVEKPEFSEVESVDEIAFLKAFIKEAVKAFCKLGTMLRDAIREHRRE